MIYHVCNHNFNERDVLQGPSIVYSKCEYLIRIPQSSRQEGKFHTHKVYVKTNTYDCNWTRTQNHLVLKRTLNHLAKLAIWASLAKWLSVRLRTKWFWVRVQLQSLHLQISRLLRARSSLTFRQLWSVDSLSNAYVT